jgi:Putative transposase
MELPDGRLLYRLKHPWRDGTSAVAFEKKDFMAKLAVLVPAPRAHLTRYHGLLAPAALWRPLIIPTTQDAHGEIPSNPQPSLDPSTARFADGQPVRRRNYTWSELMRRVFLADVLECERCGGPMKILAAIHPLWHLCSSGFRGGSGARVWQITSGDRRPPER